MPESAKGIRSLAPDEATADDTDPFQAMLSSSRRCGDSVRKSTVRSTASRMP
jgi:hypothetical protein